MVLFSAFCSFSSKQNKTTAVPQEISRKALPVFGRPSVGTSQMTGRCLSNDNFSLYFFLQPCFLPYFTWIIHNKLIIAPQAVQTETGRLDRLDRLIRPEPRRDQPLNNARNEPVKDPQTELQAPPLALGQHGGQLRRAQ